jgi:MFS-type transporter involved in bile tolerance (Atg22 family)
MIQLDSMNDHELKEIWAVLSLVILVMPILLGATVSPKRRKALLFCLALAGIPIGINLDGGLEWVGIGNCSTVGLPIMLVSLAAIGIGCRSVFDWCFNRRKSEIGENSPRDS